jgi:hypothetical protein
LFQLLDVAMGRYHEAGSTPECQQAHTQLIVLVLKCLQELSAIPISQFTSLENKKVFVENFTTHLQWFLRFQNSTSAKQSSTGSQQTVMNDDSSTGSNQIQALSGGSCSGIFDSMKGGYEQVFLADLSILQEFLSLVARFQSNFNLRHLNSTNN